MVTYCVVAFLYRDYPIVGDFDHSAIIDYMLPHYPLTVFFFINLFLGYCVYSCWKDPCKRLLILKSISSPRMFQYTLVLYHRYMLLNNFVVLFVFYSMPSILQQSVQINWMFIHHRVTCIYSKCKHTLQSTRAFLDVSLFWATLFSECSVRFVALSPVTIKLKLNHSHTNHSS